MEIIGLDLHKRQTQLSIKAIRRSRRPKTDQREARTLMDACETGAWRPAYRLSEARRHDRRQRHQL